MKNFAIYTTILVFLSVIFYIYKTFNDFSIVYVDTQFGRIKGFTALSGDKRKFSSFRAIPYAKQPIEQLRFEAPLEFGGWDETFDGTGSIPLCKQFDYFFEIVRGQESCLVLSVYTPKIEKFNEGPLLPVMVFFHGGHFMLGGSDVYGPQVFMNEDVVLVTVNYRLGAFGFLNTADGIGSGNNGLKDQRLALKWVKRTIADFGGDPEKITIFGESAGAMSVHFHVLYSQGLFQNAISQSGTALCPWGFTQNPGSQAKKFGQKLNCPIEDSKQMLDCLRDKTDYEIVSIHFETADIFYDPSAIFAPSIEKVTEENKDIVFIHKSPSQVLEEGNFTNSVNWMTGVNSAEGLFRSAMIVGNWHNLNRINKNWVELADRIGLLYRENENEKKEDAEKIWNFYFGTKKELNKDDLDAITNLYGDRYFHQCTNQAAFFHAKNKEATYLYYFDYKGGVSIANAMIGKRGNLPSVLEFAINFAILKSYQLIGWDIPFYGVSHGDELQYLFKIILMEMNEESEDYKFAKSLVKLWVSFAKNGKPDEFNGLKWEKYDGQNPPEYLYIGNSETKIISEPFSEGVSFWNSLNPPSN